MIMNSWILLLFEAYDGGLAFIKMARISCNKYVVNKLKWL